MAVESHRILGMTVALQGNLWEAERVLREAMTLPGAGAYTEATLAWVLARAGKREDATRILSALETQAQHGYVSPVAFAIAHIGLGNLDTALDWTERAYDERRGWLAYFKVNAMVDPLRGLPRFDALLEKLNF